MLALIFIFVALAFYSSSMVCLWMNGKLFSTHRHSSPMHEKFLTLNSYTNKTANIISKRFCYTQTINTIALHCILCWNWPEVHSMRMWMNLFELERIDDDLVHFWLITITILRNIYMACTYLDGIFAVALSLCFFWGPG